MNPFSCSTAARQAGEDLSGTAGHYQTYILIECPLPWPAAAFDSPSIPPELRHYVKAASANKAVRFLCINRGTPNASKQTTLLIYEQFEQSAVILAANDLTDGNPTDSRFTQGYRGYEFNLDSLDQVVALFRSLLAKQGFPKHKNSKIGPKN